MVSYIKYTTGAWLGVILLLMHSKTVKTGNILCIFPHFGYSHFKVIQPILSELAQRGHTLTVISYNANRPIPENYTELLISNITELAKTTVNVCTIDEFEPTRSLHVLYDEYQSLHQEGQETCERLYQSEHITTVLTRHAHTPYDLVITEYFNSDCVLGIPFLMKNVPVVGVSSCALMPWNYDRINLPDTPSYIQSEFIGFPIQLNWAQRVINFIQAKTLKTLYRFKTNAKDSEIIKKYLGVDVDVHELTHSLTSMILVNTHYTLLGSRPTTAQLVEIGGVHIQPKQLDAPLPNKIRTFLDNANGSDVLFISWGSMLRASSIEKEKLNIIIRALQQQPLKVIWKWETVEKPIDSEQFLFVNWAPQLSLLCHPQIKLFWSHGGLLGVTEAVYCGKPLIVTPIYGDQFLNAHAVENRGVALIVKYNDINENSLLKNLHYIQDNGFKRNAEALSRIFRDRPVTPLNASVWSIETILQHGSLATTVRQTPAGKLNWFVYHSFDIILLPVAVFMVVVSILQMWIYTKVKRENVTEQKRKTK